MGLWDWIKGVFGPTEATRRVSSLEDDGLSVDAAHEKIDLTGKPLKPKNLRKGLRDKRLLPKPQPKWSARRKKVMTKEHAARLFSATMRTKNRKIRDLAPDETQLVKLGLPNWRSETDVAEALGITERELWHYASHRKADRLSHYVTFAIPKRSGGERIIMAPKKKLKALQRALLEKLVGKLPQSEYSHAFRKGRSIKTGAEPHVGKAVLLKMDLESFFPSVTFRRARGLFISVGYGYPVATCLATIMTEAERQRVDLDGDLRFVPVGDRYCVQGAPTSPALCNAIAMRLDHRLAGLARKYGLTYTRYADDLTFSGDDMDSVHLVRKLATEIIQAEGFRVNRKKTRVQKRGNAQRVTGVTVNETLGLSRKERRRLRAMIHQHGSNSEKKREIAGHVAYVKMLNPDQAGRLLGIAETALLLGEDEVA